MRLEAGCISHILFSLSQLNKAGFSLLVGLLLVNFVLEDGRVLFIIPARHAGRLSWLTRPRSLRFWQGLHFPVLVVLLHLVVCL